MNTTIINTKGVAAVTLAATLKAAELDWEPMSSPVHGIRTLARGGSADIQVPGKKLLYRSDNYQALGIVGENYEPSQPREFLKDQFELADKFDSEVVRAGFLEGCSQAFAFIRYGKEIVIPKALRKVGDLLQAYIYSTDGWDGGTPRQSRLYIERLICANGAARREIKANLWVKHTSNMEQRYELRWKAFQQAVNLELDRVRAEFTVLAQTRMSLPECEAFLEKLIPGDTTRAENRREQLFDLFNAGVGNEGNTRWDAYNAVTEHVTHHRNYRQTEGTLSDTNRFLGVLQTDTLSQRALSLLLEARN